MVDELIEVESTGRLGRLRQRIKERKEAFAAKAATKRATRREAKAAIETIRMEERKSLQRRFIREQEKQRLAKKFGVKKIVTTKTKRIDGKPVKIVRIEQFGKPDRGLFGLSQPREGQKSAGEQIFQGLSENATMPNKKKITLADII